MDDDALCQALGITVMEPWAPPPPELLAVAGDQVHPSPDVPWRLLAHVPHLRRFAFVSPVGGLLVTDDPHIHLASLRHRFPCPDPQLHHAHLLS